MRTRAAEASPISLIKRGVCASPAWLIASRIAGELEGGNVVFIIPDDGWKYLSSGVYTKPIEEIENLDSTVWW